MSDRRWTGAGVVIKGKNGDPDRLWQIGPNQNGDFIYADGTVESGIHLYPYPTTNPVPLRIDRPCMVQVRGLQNNSKYFFLELMLHFDKL